MHAVLNELDILLSHVKLSKQRQSRLDIVQHGCRDCLESIRIELLKYKSLATEEKRLEDKVRWSIEDVGALRIRLVSNTTVLTLFTLALYR